MIEKSALPYYLRYEQLLACSFPRSGEDRRDSALDLSTFRKAYATARLAAQSFRQPVHGEAVKRGRTRSTAILP